MKWHINYQKWKLPNTILDMMLCTWSISDQLQLMKRSHRRLNDDRSWKWNLLLNLVWWHYKICLSHYSLDSVSHLMGKRIFFQSLNSLEFKKQISNGRKSIFCLMHFHICVFYAWIFHEYFHLETKKIEIKKSPEPDIEMNSLENGNNECSVWHHESNFPFHWD